MKSNIIFILKLIFILLLFAVFFSYAMFQGGFVSWFLFYSFLPIIAYMLLLLLYPVASWQISRNVTTRVLEASHEVNMEIIINRKLPFPIYYCVIEEDLPASLHRQDTNREKYRHMENQEMLSQRRVVRKVLFPWFNKTIRCSYTLELLPRGEHHLQAIRVKCGDFFGFIKKEHTFQVSDVLLVYPAKRGVVLSEKSSSFAEGAATAHNFQNKSSNVVTGVREYMPGDRYSWIDWKTTARRETVMTKEFEQEKSSSVLVLLDSTAYPKMNRLAYEGSVELTSSLIESLRKSDSSFAFLSLGKEKILYPFKADPVKKRGIFQSLAKVNPGESESFARLAEQELAKLPAGIVIMAVTTRLDPESKRAIDKMKKKSKRVILLLVKAEKEITEQEQAYIRELNVSGIVVNLITEEKLIKKKFEVKT